MTPRLRRLGPSAGAPAAAALLAERHHVQLSLLEAQRAPPGFVLLPGTIDLWSDTGRALERPAGQVLERWGDQVELAVADVESFGLERLVQQVYFGLIVRYGYCTGVELAALNLDTFRRVATPDVLVTTASSGGTLAAACLLQPSRRTPFGQGRAPRLASDAAHLDVVAQATVGLSPDEADAFFAASLEMLAAHGYRAVRVRESPVVRGDNAARLARNLRRADELGFELAVPAVALSLAPLAAGQGEALGAFALSDEGLQYRSTGGGAPAALAPVLVAKGWPWLQCVP